MRDWQQKQESKTVLNKGEWCYGIPEPAGANQYPQPPLGAVVINPSDRIAAIVEAAPEGAAFVLMPGEYRVGSIRVKAEQKFYGSIGPAGERLSTLNGSLLLTGFSKGTDGLWSAPASTHPTRTPYGNYYAEYEGNAFPEGLYFDGQFVPRRVRTLAEVKGPTDWFFDYTAKRCYVFADPAGKKVELGRWPSAFTGIGQEIPGLAFYNLRIINYANAAQASALCDKDMPRSWVEYCEAAYNHGNGVRANSLTRCFLHHNGHNGGTVRGLNPYMGWNEISYNNQLNVNPDWEAGGCKVAVSTNLLSECNYVHHNRGRGLWTDIDNRDSTYRNNVIFLNTHDGLMHEISGSCLAERNVAFWNGEPNAQWLYGAQLLIASSSDTTYRQNLVEARTSPAITYLLQNRDEETPRKYAGQRNKIVENRIQFAGTTANRWGCNSDIKAEKLRPGETATTYLTGCSLDDNILVPPLNVSPGVIWHGQKTLPIAQAAGVALGTRVRPDRLDVSLYTRYVWQDGWLRLPDQLKPYPVDLTQQQMEELLRIKAALAAIETEAASLKQQLSESKQQVTEITEARNALQSAFDALQQRSVAQESLITRQKQQLSVFQAHKTALENVLKLAT